MKTKTTLCTIIFTVFALMGACAFAGGIPDEVSSLSAGGSAVEKSGSGGVLSSMDLYAGQDAVLKLKADKDLGYTWEIAEPWDENVLELVGKEILSPSSKGALGTEIWTFKALKPGRVELAFRYIDSNGDASPESKNAVFAVIVKEGAASKTGPTMGKEAPHDVSGTVESIEFAGAMTRVNPRLVLRKDTGELMEFVVKPLCYVYRSTGHVSAREITKGASVSVNYRVSKKGVNEAVAIRIE